MIELWLAELAYNFWEGAGGFGEDLETAMVISLPIVPACISHLTLYKALDWLQQHGVGLKLQELERVRDRPLRACLVAYGEPRNYVLWDDTDPPADQLFSLAHEVAHFLLDYEQPRQKAVRLLGPQVLKVFDGLEQPTLDERLYSLIGGMQLGPQHHFMERGKQGDILSRRILEIESRADQLALEILAPEERTLPLVQAAIKGKPNYEQRLQAAHTALVSQFRLAPNVARPYATQLLKLAGGQQSFGEWLKS